MKSPILNSKPLVYGTIAISLIIYFFITFAAKAESLQEKSKKKQEFTLKSGDILFQSGDSKQCEAVKLATHSEFSHCGIYLIDENQIGYVYEAVQPVRKTPLAQWIKQGLGAKYSVSRLKSADKLINDSTSRLLRNEAQTHLGKDYDIYFGWSDDKLYCSEYVWKIYKNALNIDLCTLKTLKDFDLSSAQVSSLIRERYGKNIPYNDKVVAPSDLYKSTHLVSIQ
ncbi:MAG TPA: YiiX family permuted papain-like enzyme [Cytophagales bacterium]|nr:YiiX family permuted papain-like enzyme [Cytophagales bacterium]